MRIVKNDQLHFDERSARYHTGNTVPNLGVWLCDILTPWHVDNEKFSLILMRGLPRTKPNRVKTNAVERIAQTRWPKTIKNESRTTLWKYLRKHYEKNPKAQGTRELSDFYIIGPVPPYLYWQVEAVIKLGSDNNILLLHTWFPTCYDLHRRRDLPHPIEVIRSPTQKERLSRN